MPMLQREHACQRVCARCLRLLLGGRRTRRSACTCRGLRPAWQEASACEFSRLRPFPPSRLFLAGSIGLLKFPRAYCLGRCVPRKFCNMRPLHLLGSLTLVLALMACSSSDGSGTGQPKKEGAEGNSCYPNGTCDAGLTCLSKLCVVAEASGGTGGTGGGAAAGTSGTTAGTGNTAQCVNVGDDCSAGTCCNGSTCIIPAGDMSLNVCAANCLKNSDCTSNCCTKLKNAPSATCSMPELCAPVDCAGAACAVNGDCCAGHLCVGGSCAFECTTSAECQSGCCALLAGGGHACGPVLPGGSCAP